MPSTVWSHLVELRVLKLTVGKGLSEEQMTMVNLDEHGGECQGILYLILRGAPVNKSILCGYRHTGGGRMLVYQTVWWEDYLSMVGRAQRCCWYRHFVYPIHFSSLALSQIWDLFIWQTVACYSRYHSRGTNECRCRSRKWPYGEKDSASSSDRCYGKKDIRAKVTGLEDLEFMCVCGNFFSK